MTPNSPANTPHLILNMLRGTATKFSNLFSVSFLIKHGTPLARVCRFLRQLSRSHNNAKAFPLDMTQLELASVLDIHRVSLFRCLQQLRELGILVRFSRHEIELSELDQLEKLLEEQEEAEWADFLPGADFFELFAKKVTTVTIFCPESGYR